MRKTRDDDDEDLYESDGKWNVEEAIHRAIEGTEVTRTGRVKNRLGDRLVFARNLRMLTALKGLKATTAAAAIQKMRHLLAEQRRKSAISEREKKNVSIAVAEINDHPISAKWFRRLMQRGITRANKGKLEHVNAVAIFFGVDYEDLWDKSLQDRFATAPSQSAPSITSVYAKKLAYLLDKGNGRYDYLMALIDSLSSELRRNEKARSQKRKR